MEFELIVLLVVSENFYVVVEDVPGHVKRIEALTPAAKSGCPKVHSQALSLVKVLHSGIVHVDMADLVAVDNPRNVVRSPFHFISVPVIMWVEMLSGVM